MKKVLIAIALMSSSLATVAMAGPAVLYYPQAQGIQAVYDNLYVGYSAKSKDETTTTVRENYAGTGQSYVSKEQEWFDYNVQVGAVGYTDYGVYPFAGLTYSKEYSHEVINIGSQPYAEYSHKDNTVGFEAGVMYEFYPQALVAVKYTTQYNEVQFGVGFKF